MTSLRRTIITWTTLLLGIVGISATLVVYAMALSDAGEFMDDQLRQFADMTDVKIPRFEETVMLQEPEDRYAVRIWGADGRLERATSEGPEIMVPPQLGFSAIDRPNDSWRTYVKHTGQTTLMVAQRMSAREELAQHSALGVAVPILFIVPAMWLIVVVTVGRVLQKLAKLASQIATYGVDAHDPLSIEALPLEIHPLVAAINRLIERQETTLDQQRRFIANSAHELRTPLAALRIQIDNIESADRRDSEAATTALRGGIARAAGMVDQLLKLARFEGSAPPGRPELLDACEVLTQCVADAVEIADAAGIDIGLMATRSAMVDVVRADLTLAISNLIDNAIRYTPRPGSVDCEVRTNLDEATIMVRDTGPGVTPEDLRHLTDRFFRGATREAEGSGLGLSIVKAIADVHKWHLAIANRADRSGLSVEIRVPLAAPNIPA